MFFGLLDDPRSLYPMISATDDHFAFVPGISGEQNAIWVHHALQHLASGCWYVRMCVCQCYFQEHEIPFGEPYCHIKISGPTPGPLVERTSATIDTHGFCYGVIGSVSFPKPVPMLDVYLWKFSCDPNSLNQGVDVVLLQLFVVVFDVFVYQRRPFLLVYSF